MGNLFTPGHILLIVIAALLLFGPSKLPELGRGFGTMLREFKAGTRQIMSDDDGQNDSHSHSALPKENQQEGRK